VAAEDLVAGVVLLALAAYAIFGGADFGGGVWSALAFGRRRKEVREAILRAMGPVWETNHVWLILVLVTLWTCFPRVFAALFESLFLPLTVALLGIVFRGAAFAFRHYGGTSEAGLPATGVVFSMASTITPFAMGIAVGAVADGRIAAGGPTPGVFEAWLHPFPLLCGAIALAVCAFLTPFYMLARPLGALRQEFRRMAVLGSLALGAATTLAIPVAALAAPAFYDRLFGARPLALVAVAVCLGLCSLWVLVALPIGALVLVPSLVFLFSLFATTRLDDPE
jgi:cytochrome bd ubiquinol oxidase subunit II